MRCMYAYHIVMCRESGVYVQSMEIDASDRGVDVGVMKCIKF